MADDKSDLKEMQHERGEEKFSLVNEDKEAPSETEKLFSIQNFKNWKHKAVETRKELKELYDAGKREAKRIKDDIEERFGIGQKQPEDSTPALDPEKDKKLLELAKAIAQVYDKT